MAPVFWLSWCATFLSDIHDHDVGKKKVKLEPRHTPITSNFHDAKEVDTTRIDAFIRRTTHRLLVAPMPKHLTPLLPKAKETWWSVIDELLARQKGIPVSLPAMQREVSRQVVQYAANRTEYQSVAEVKALLASTNTPSWHDVEGFVRTYRSLVEEPASPISYNKEIQIWNLNKPFPLSSWWELHRQGCDRCEEHLRAHGSEIAALSNNASNPCYFADIMCWLSAGWRMPLSELHEPDELPNHSSLYWSPSSVIPEVERMFDWGVLVPTKPRLVHPIMSVIRDGDLNDALRVLAKVGTPSPSERKEDVDIINEHIRTVLRDGRAIPPEVGVLKPIKVSYATYSIEALMRIIVVQLH